MKNFGGKIFVILVLGIFSSGFFIGQNCLAAGEVVINEAAWMGSAVSANAEWIELKNLSQAEIDLSGWTLNAADGAPIINLSGIIPASGYYLLERTSDESAPGLTADLIYTGALGNGGESLELKDSAGNSIDALNASSGWPAGDNDTKQTMERKADGSWQTSANSGGTPKAINSQESGAENDNDQGSSGQALSGDSSRSGASFGGSADSRVSYGAVLINEFLSIPDSVENEWIELYNRGGKELSLDGWTIADGSGAETILSGGFSEDNLYFFAVEKPKGALNNDGDEIVLYDFRHNVIDKTAYGKYGDQPENNAPAPAKGESCALKIDGQKNSSAKASFAVSAAPTKGRPNIIQTPESSADSGVEAPAEKESGKIFITEIFPNPAGSDRAGEFVELYNSSDQKVDLAGWRLEIENGRLFEFGKFFNVSRVLQPSEYFALYRSESNLVLNNNGGKIRLFAPNKNKAAQLLEYESAPEGASFCDTENIDLKNISSSTKKYLRNSLMANRWAWSEALTPGRANQIKIANQPPKISLSAPDKITTGALVAFDASDSYDENGDELHYIWDFGDGAPISLETPSHIFYKPGTYKVKLVASDGLASSVLEKVFKVSGLDMTLKETPAANKDPIVLKNDLKASDISGDQAAESASPGLAGAKKNVSLAVAAISKKVSAPAAKAAAVSLPAKKTPSENSLSNLKLGAAKKISGTVAVLPGTFGTQYFYVVPAPGASAIKIYSYYKDFPALAIGDLIQAAGVIGGSEADKYLKTKSAANIKISGQAEMPVPEKITAAGFKEENLGKFVSAEGEVESRDASGAVINDGSGKINLYFKAAAKIDSKKIKAGQKIIAAGLLNKNSGALAIWPRGDFDLVIATSSASAEAGLVLGAATGTSAWVLPARENNSQPLIYGLIVAGGIIIVLAGWLAKKYFLTK